MFPSYDRIFHSREQFFLVCVQNKNGGISTGGAFKTLNSFSAQNMYLVRASVSHTNMNC